MDADTEDVRRKPTDWTGLRPGERVLWRGAPRQGVLFRPADAFVIPFALAITGMVAFLEVELGHLRSTASSPSLDTLVVLGLGKIVPLGLVLVGSYLAFGRFAMDAWLRRRTSYIVTNERLGIATHRGTSWYELDDVDRLTLVEWRDGGGNVAFGPFGRLLAECSFALGAPMTPRHRMPVTGLRHYEGPHFDAVDAARSLHELIERAWNERKGPRASGS